MFKTVSLALACALFGCLSQESSTAQAGKQNSGDAAVSARRAIEQAKAGSCKQALPALKSAARIADKDLRRDVGFAGVRCAMFANQADVAIDFLRALTHEYPHDPEVLYLAVHTYSDLSTRASAELASTNSYQAQQLNAEALEIQGKWDEAAKVYRTILQQNPNLPGIHYRLGRILVSRPGFGPEAAEEAKQEFEKELQIDPANAGAEYVLGEIAKQNEQWEDALRHFSNATKIDTGFGDAYVGWGGALVSLKKFSDAIPPLETAVKLESENPSAHYLLAIAYARSGRKEDGDREFEIQRRLTQKGAAGEPAAQTPRPN